MSNPDREAYIEKLEGAIHGAVSNTYIEGEEARLYTRKLLKDAMGWPHDPKDLERYEQLYHERILGWVP